MAAPSGSVSVPLAPVNTSASSFITSPTMTTPRPLTATLQSQPFSLAPPDHTTPRKDQKRNGTASPQTSSQTALETGEEVKDTTDVSAEDKGEKHNGEEEGGNGDIDGRLTPLASESSRVSHSGSSGPSDPQPGSPQSLPTIPSTSSLASTNLSTTAPADIGLCNLATEKQLREAVIGKDRMFLLLLSREFESYIHQIILGEHQPLPPSALTNSAFAALSHAFPLSTITMSKYQRMLVYKVAEWYGLKGIAGPDGAIYIGVLSSLNSRSGSLRLADIAPKPPSPKQSFKIMQRVPLGSTGGPGSSRGGSVIGDDSSEAGTSKRKTLEEREAEYALARERIYGANVSVPNDPPQDEEPRGRSTRPTTAVDDEDDPISRRNYGNHGAAVSPVYPSLYHPPKPSPSPNPSLHNMHNQNPQYPPPDSMSSYQSAMAYPPYGQMAPAGFPGFNAYGQVNNAYPGQPQQVYMDGQYLPPQPGYNGQSWSAAPHLNGQPLPPNMQGQMQIPQMPTGWTYNGIPMMNPIQPMPMIPQGLPAFQPPHGQPPYGYPQQQQQYSQQHPMYPPLMQPTPVRPGPLPHTHPHSSNSSSISSRSYQDYSRPHSRGSTTSTRSAASSVRLGHMYPAGTPGYRQKGIRGPGFNGMTSLALGDRGERRSTRGHSPSSVGTTTSSRSSRRAASINLQAPQPGQHQLPQKPDWAANNIPYHPAPLPVQYAGQTLGGPSNSDFPPLLRNGTNAEPMQVERAKMRPANGNGLNGVIGKTMPPPYPQQQQPYSPQNGSAAFAQAIPPPSHTPRPPAEADPDFPRRVPSTRTATTLYDPTAKSEPSSAASTSGLSVQDEIEAKLAALSVNSGISIGPPPTKAPSYAKIVRRD